VSEWPFRRGGQPLHEAGRPGEDRVREEAGLLDGSSDAELVARCRQDRAALHGSFQALYARHAGGAYRFLRLMVGEAQAGDCLQETFLRVYRHLDRYDPRKPFGPWLLGIARHVALDALRRDSRRPAEPLPAGELPAGGEPVPAVAARREVDGLVREAVEGLPPTAREVFLLKQVEGLTFDEVAAALGCSVRTAKYRMKAAIDALAAVLRQRGLVAGAGEGA